MASVSAARGWPTSLTERLGLSLWEVPPGETAYPYHFHLAEEEVLVVLAGAPLLRDPDGWRQLREGDVLAFPVGERGAHQIANRTQDTIRFLAVSTHGQPEIVVYPDSGKVGAAERRSDRQGLRMFFHQEDAVDYWDRERPPAF